MASQQQGNKESKIMPVYRRFLLRGYKSVWLFPALIIVMLFVATLAQVSGTSAGVLNQLLYGKDAADPALIYGKPQTIRSDEWLTNTELVIAQSVSDFPRINENIQDGRDMSVVVDVPYREWSALFKPQNLIFFALPLEQAFAFKWWLLLAALIISIYFLTLRLLPGKRLVAALFSTAFSISPFILWWYQTITVGPLIYGALIILLGMRIIDGKHLPLLRSRPLRYSNAVYGLVMTYLLACFGLIIYPPFQIPVALVVAAFLLGHLLKIRQARSLSLKGLLPAIMTIGISAVLGLLVIGAFIYTRQEAVNAIQNTVYPGERSVSSGGAGLMDVFSGFLQYQLQLPEQGKNFYNNQSEVSNFILFVPFLMLPCLAVIYRDIRRKSYDWPLILVTLICLLLLARMYVPGLDLPSKLLMLQAIPHNRLLIGLGFAGLLQILLLSSRLAGSRYTKRITLSLGLYLVIVVGLLVWIGAYVRSEWPLFAPDWPVMIGLILGYSSILGLVLFRKLLLAGLAFLLFSIASAYQIQPLYRGLGLLADSPIQSAMRQISKTDDTWVIADNIYFENFALLSDRDSQSGIQFYPDVDYWRELNAPNSNRIFNRYAHVVHNSSDTIRQPVRLTQSDFVQVTLRCDQFTRENVDFVLSTVRFNKPCLRYVQVLQYPNVNLYIYRHTD